jgi:hypothetical protein
MVLTLAGALAASGCGKARADFDPKAIEATYGVTGAYVDKISTQNGEIDATIVPTTLNDGRRVQLVIPHQTLDPRYKVYMREGVTITPVDLAGTQPTALASTAEPEPRVAPSQPTRSTYVAPRKKRSTKDELLIVGGSAGAGTAIGAIAGGKKGAAIGGLSGGVAGLVYDLATKNK